MLSTRQSKENLPEACRKQVALKFGCYLPSHWTVLEYLCQVVAVVRGLELFLHIENFVGIASVPVLLIFLKLEDGDERIESCLSSYLTN